MLYSVLGGLVLCLESSPPAFSVAIYKIYSEEKP